ncbi:DMT family transporter [Fangia hongkongensis]|uniref:DMT family transporter n=1 Tax=Fangia hongkongensis TaxID=270495 RepID=UPI00037615CC|nr:DMT family transporter [Fangia hongkongensis]MBK2125774.1 DMT family transporter [Fangia hongkongensis]
MSVFYLILAQVVTGINITGSKYLVAHLPIVALLEIRFIVGSIVLLCCIPFFNKQQKSASSIRALNKSDWGILILQALCAGMFFNLMMLSGIQFTSASMAGLITSTLPAIIIVLSFFIFKQRITRFKLLCIIFATIGLIAINAPNMHGSSFSAYSLLGDVIILFAMIPEALYYVLSKFKATKLSAVKAAFLMNLINAIAMLPIIFFAHWGSLLELNLTGSAVLLLVSIVSALFYLFWFMGCNQVSSTTAGLITAFMPISTLGLSFIFLGEKITLIQGIGTLLILLSIIFGSRKA